MLEMLFVTHDSFTDYSPYKSERTSSNIPVIKAACGIFCESRAIASP